MHIVGTFAAFISAVVVALVVGAIAAARTASGWTRVVFPSRQPA